MVKEESYSDDDVQESIDEPIRIHTTKETKYTEERKVETKVNTESTSIVSNKPVVPLEEVQKLIQQELHKMVTDPSNKNWMDAVKGIEDKKVKYIKDATGAVKLVHNEMNDRVTRILTKEENMNGLYELQTALLFQPINLETQIMLQEFGLSIADTKDDRNVPYSCQIFRSLPILGEGNYMEKLDLVRFIGKNPFHELGLYSKVIDGKNTCYYIVDLFTYLNTHDDSNFTTEDKTEISLWYHAYTRFLELVKNGDLPRIKTVSHLLKPGKKGVTYWDKLKLQLKGMLTIIKIKFAFDVFYAVWCYIMKGLILFQSWQNGFGGWFAWEIIKDLLIGDLVFDLISLYKRINGIQENGGGFWSSVKSTFSDMFTGVFGEFGQSIIGVYNVLETMAPQTLNLLFVGLSTVGGAGYMAYMGQISTATFTGYLGASTQFVTLLGECARFELNKNLLLSFFQILNPHKMKGLSWLLALLVPANFCNLAPFSSVRAACRTLTRTLAILVGWFGPMRVILDCFIDMGVLRSDILGESRCMTLFNRSTGAKETMQTFTKATTNSSWVPEAVTGYVSHLYNAYGPKRFDNIINEDLNANVYEWLKANKRDPNDFKMYAPDWAYRR